MSEQPELTYGFQSDPGGSHGIIPCGPIQYGPFQIDICWDGCNGGAYLIVRTKSGKRIAVMANASNSVDLREERG